MISAFWVVFGLVLLKLLTLFDVVFTFAVVTFAFTWGMVVLWFSQVPVELIAIVWASKMRAIV